MKEVSNFGLKWARTVFLLIFIFPGLFRGELLSQTVSKANRQSSIEAFSNGRYEEAYSQFSELLKIYPRDPLYKYYSGICLIELKRDPGSAASLLQDALKGAAGLKSLPDDALFYLGRAQHMAGRFNEAIDAYRKYEDLAGKKISREKGVQDLIQQCLNSQGQLAVKEPAAVSPVPVNKQPAEADPVGAAPKPEVKENLPPAYEKLIQEALKLQFSADSVSEILAERKNALASVPAEKKEAEKKYISLLGLTAASYQKRADQKFTEAAALKPGGSVSKYIQSPAKKTPVVIPDTVKPASSPVVPAIEAPPAKPAPTVKSAPVQQKEGRGVFSEFEVLARPADEPIKVDPDVPEGLVYRIQMAVFRNPVRLPVFKGIIPVYGFRLTSNGLTNYYAGMFRLSADASRALIKVKSSGFRDSFIVPFLGKKPISAEKASALEKEWGKVPLYREPQKEEQAADTLPPALVFRVEVTRSVKPLDEKKTEELRKVAGSRGLDIITTDDGSKIYLIGKFITFESAAEYNDILVRNGYRDAKVVAWLGRKEIPVETAKRLFENIE